MKINFSQIYEGWKNNLFPADDMKERIREISHNGYLNSTIASIERGVACII
jgi:hypothetical protein